MRHSVQLATVLALALGCSDSGNSPDSTVDPRSQAYALATDPIPCTATADCCVVEDGCMATMLMVSSGDRSRTAEYLSRAPRTDCLSCITPAVQVDCRLGHCVAFRIVPGDGGVGFPPGDFSTSHCGVLTVPPGWQEAPAGMMKTRIGSH